MACLLVTGGAGFIGANFVLRQIGQGATVVNLDKLTYAGNRENLAAVEADPAHHFVAGDIADRTLVARVLREHRPDAIVNFAAESHVDRSIHGPEDFIQTNVVGTFHLLQEALGYWRDVREGDAGFRFLHVSTDEVYGTLDPDAAAFTETSPYAPNSPYSASKAASDHLVRAYHHTYGLPTLTTNCSNNYGPFQFPEKLIPLVIHNAIAGRPLPIYGDGKQVRDWLHVTDHCDAIATVLKRGTTGETYNIGGRCEKANLDVVRAICGILDRLKPRGDGKSYASQIEFVRDRPGHDRRYAVDCSRIERELGWRPMQTFEGGVAATVHWYLDHQPWVQRVVSGQYREWVGLQYGAAQGKVA